jgi:hypothetical protein
MSSAPAQVSAELACALVQRTKSGDARSCGQLWASGSKFGSGADEQSSKANHPEGPLEFRIIESAGQLWQQPDHMSGSSGSKFGFGFF